MPQDETQIDWKAHFQALEEAAREILKCYESHVGSSNLEKAMQHLAKQLPASSQKLEFTIQMEHKIYSASERQLNDDQLMCQALDWSAQDRWHLVAFQPPNRFIFARELQLSE